MKAIKLTGPVQPLIHTDGTKTLNNEAELNQRDKMVALAIAFLIVVQIYWFLIPKLVDNWYDGRSKYIGASLNFISAFAPLILAFTFKDRIYRMVGIILSVLSVLIAIYSNIEWVTR